MKEILSLLRPILKFSAFLFPFVLVFYLILFLLENIFPGFVSNVVDLNYFLIPVLVFGLLAAFANKEEERNEKEPTRWDFMLIAGLTALSFVILLYKTANLGWMGFLISLISSSLISLVSLVIIVPEAAENQVDRALDRKDVEKFLLSPLGISSIVLFLIIIICGSFFAFSQKKPQPQERITGEISIPIENPVVKSPGEAALEETPVLVLNGTGKPGTASAMAKFLEIYDFGNIKTGDAQNSNYKNAILQFNQESASVASYIAFLLNDQYKIINMLPQVNTSQSGIILILGSQ